MLFHLTTDDHINEQGPAETDAGCITFASEQDFYEVAKEWPMKRLVEIWNRLPGVEAVARFTDRKTAVARIWRAIQPQTEADRPSTRRASKTQHRPVFREDRFTSIRVMPKSPDKKSALSRVPIRKLAARLRKQRK